MRVSPKPQHLLAFGLSAGLAVALNAQAGARPSEINRLGADLTPVGAERQGNADGAIPDWNGGISEPPVPYQPGDHHPDPFPDDQKLFRIDASNLDAHRDRLGAGQQAMLERFPDFYLEVYPTRRTAAFPQRIYEKTAENAISGRLIDDGNAVVDVAEGFPFPFPENAQELIWNHRLRYKGTGSIRHINMIAPTTGGAYTEVLMTVTTTNPYYRAGETLESIDNHLLMFLREIISPPRLAGNVLLVYESLNQAKQPRKAWVYNPGQRRVIRAPNVAYDSPSGATDGLHVSDMTDMFNGALDRFEWKIVGKRELYVPYNAYRVHSNEIKYDDLVRPGHLEPSYMRYELHRVWVVEATLREGYRHINPRRTYYLDEDSYQILLADHYDANGELWRYSEAHPINFYDVPVFWTTLEVHYDLDASRYAAFRLDPNRPVPPFNMDLNMSDFTPQALRRKGHR